MKVTDGIGTETSVSCCVSEVSPFRLQEQSQGTDGLHFEVNFETYCIIWISKVTDAICSFSLAR